MVSTFKGTVSILVFVVTLSNSISTSISLYPCSTIMLKKRLNKNLITKFFPRECIDNKLEKATGKGCLPRQRLMIIPSVSTRTAIHQLVKGVNTQLKKQRVPQGIQKKMDGMVSFLDQRMENAVVAALNYFLDPQSQMAVTRMDRRTTEKA